MVLQAPIINIVTEQISCVTMTWIDVLCSTRLLFHLIKIFSLFKGPNFLCVPIVSRRILRASELQSDVYSFLDILRRRVSDKSTRRQNNREVKQIA